ncbi:hypothetical protein C0991_002593 [Blastosporella zonata]|nr:hypothetical protein C0991_002593 [Blastosporella zonata]
MFSKALSVALAIALTFSTQVSAHAAVAPMLGVAGTPARSDVQRPLLLAPCGLKADVAGTIDSSTPIPAAADGSFVATVTNFNPGLDGSRQVTMKVDPTGSGKNANFVTGTVTQNGDRAPKDVGSQQLTASLPAGMKCTGGTAGNLCLASFKNAFGFGNCVVIQQSSDNSTASSTSTADATSSTAAVDTSTSDAASASTIAASASATATDVSVSASSTVAAAASSSSAASTTTTSDAAEAASPLKQAISNLKSGLKSKLNLRAAAGTRAARALRAGKTLSKRNSNTVFGWMWA